MTWTIDLAFQFEKVRQFHVCIDDVIVVTLWSGTGKNPKEIVPQSIVNRIVMNMANNCNLVLYKFFNRLLFVWGALNK